MFGVNVCQRLVLRRCHAGTASENVLDIQGTLSGGRDPHRRQRWLSWFSGAKKPDRCGELAWYADLLSLCLDSQVSSKIVNPVEMWSGADLWGPEQQDWSPYVRVRARGEQEAQRQHAASWAPAASDWEALLSTLVFILLAPTTQIWAPVTSSTGLKDKANRTPPPPSPCKLWRYDHVFLLGYQSYHLGGKSCVPITHTSLPVCSILILISSLSCCWDTFQRPRSGSFLWL